jgi:hypothetical protein
MSKVRLVLDCSSEQAAQVMHNPRESNGRYALVTRIASVQGEVTDQSSAEEGNAAERILVARGRYVQSLYIGSYWNDFVEDLQGWTDSSPDKKY